VPAGFAASATVIMSATYSQPRISRYMESSPACCDAA
jgi:hypothetical protein